MYKLIEKKNGERGRTFPLKGVVHEIGRASSCDIDLTDNLKASRIHARIEKDRDGWWVVDLNSTNGTFVNKEKIKTRKLEVGDEITIGDSHLIFLKEEDDKPDKDDVSTEFEQPRINIRIHDDADVETWRRRLFILIGVFLILSVGVWGFYSFYISRMARIHRTAEMINSEMQKIDLMHGDIEASKRIILNLDLMKNSLPVLIDFLAKVQENPRILNEVKRAAPDVSLASIKKGLDNAAGFQQDADSYKRIMEQVINATESFKKTQDRRTYNTLIRNYNISLNEMERAKKIFSQYHDDAASLSALLISLDKVSSGIAPGLSRHTGIILDASNKIKEDIARLINNIEVEKAFLLNVKG
ncbi:MAG: FHA domain-containing protein [Nitrospirae bacterium]|nr:FHA domain-containing protein [Nitrospirota bacterium]